ncbi:MAG: signal peptidase I [Candidatus Roizmanbacteria bacterium]|nr:signal peptidase I [Candidatus Roizmanbacteria bacterium]
MIIPFKLRTSGRIKTFGRSMEPLLHDGNIVFYRKTPFSSLKQNDIVIVYKNKKYVTHRVIYTSELYVITKGDNNNFIDGKIKPSQIVGRVYKIGRGTDMFPVDTLSLVQNASYLQEIHHITKIFQKKDIDFVFLKGLPLYFYYTKHMPQRIFADCDLLVSEKDFVRAKALLLKRGYEQKTQTRLFSRLFSQFVMEEDFFLNRRFPITIDLHKRPFSYIRKIDFPDSLYPKKLMDEFTRELLRTKRWVKVNNITIPIPHKDYLLIFLSIHFFTHTMKMVHRVWLINKIVKKDKKTPRSWQVFLELVQKYKLGYMVYPAFYFANRLYKKRVPRFVIESVKPHEKFAAQVYGLKPGLIFEERFTVSRVVNKIVISWFFSPQPVYRRLQLFVSRELFLLTVTYIVPVSAFLLHRMKNWFSKKIAKKPTD